VIPPNEAIRSNVAIKHSKVSQHDIREAIFAIYEHSERFDAREH